MDIQLPGMDGLTVTGIIKEKLGLDYIPIIALTAHAVRGDEAKVREAGCDGYINKPIDTRAIPKTIESFINGTAGNE